MYKYPIKKMFFINLTRALMQNTLFEAQKKINRKLPSQAQGTKRKE